MFISRNRKKRASSVSRLGGGGERERWENIIVLNNLTAKKNCELFEDDVIDIFKAKLFYFHQRSWLSNRPEILLFVFGTKAKIPLANFPIISRSLLCPSIYTSHRHNSTYHVRHQSKDFNEKRETAELTSLSIEDLLRKKNLFAMRETW